MQVLQDSEVQTTKLPADTIHVNINKGGARFQRKHTNNYSLQVGIAGETKRIIPTGTEFLVNTAGVDVFAGTVDIYDASESVTLTAGKRFLF
ncbi:MAG: hypothetical protein U5L00_19015 [Desulfovermiculus sp.]|nr:hypothetical protein [Desulfovermiculus sp.]